MLKLRLFKPCLLAMVVCGCATPEPPPPTFSVTVSTQSDDGRPLENITIEANGQPLGKSSKEGIIQTILEGPEGTQIELAYKCPEGYRQPARPSVLTLRRFRELGSKTGRGLNMKLNCSPLKRTAGFVVKTNKIEGIRVMLNGEQVAMTNSVGVASFAAEVDPQSDFDVILNTEATEKLATLLPVSPNKSFRIGDRDDLFVFDQQFEMKKPERKVRKRRRRRKPKRKKPRITRLN